MSDPRGDKPPFRESPALLQALADARRQSTTTALLADAGELHHRFKNELQLLAHLAEREAAPPFFSAYLRAIATLHEVMVSAPDAPEASQLLRRLAAEAWQHFGDGRRTEVVTPDAPVQVTPRVANALAVIAHELVVNAVRHGDARSITVSLSAADRGLTLRVADDGTGFPPDFAWDRDAGFGLRLAGRLADDLDGPAPRLAAAPGGGAVVEIELPNPK